MSILNFKISFPTDGGYWGRQCKQCDKYFKIEADRIKPELYCPYCGELQPNDNLWTKQQSQQAREIAASVGKRYIEDELEKMFKNAFGNSKFIKYTPGQKTTPRTFVTTHVEKPVDTEIECPTCKLKFQIYGIFGYCPSCREESLQIYETNLQIIIQEINNAPDKTRALRHAYNDVVSTFEGYCKLVAKRNELESANFQNLKSAKELFKKYQLDIYGDITENEKVIVKRIFEKRHAYQHAQGQITEKYIQNIPQDRHLLDTKAELSVSELTGGIDILKKILRIITNKYSS
jgi:Zn finger protein HypA/HybF involved in hydrogenase expression